MRRSLQYIARKRLESVSNLFIDRIKFSQKESKESGIKSTNKPLKIRIGNDFSPKNSKENDKVTFSQENTGGTLVFLFAITIIFVFLLFEGYLADLFDFLFYEISYLTGDIGSLIIVAIFAIVVFIGLGILVVVKSKTSSPTVLVAWILLVISTIMGLIISFCLSAFFSTPLIFCIFAPLILGFGLGTGVLSFLPGTAIWSILAFMVAIPVSSLTGTKLANGLVEQLTSIVSNTFNPLLPPAAHLEMPHINASIILFLVMLFGIALPILDFKNISREN